MICGDCNQQIEDEKDTASGPSGLIHRTCFKRSTAHGEVIDLFTLLDKITALQKRVQQLESVTEHHSSDISRMNWHA